MYRHLFRRLKLTRGVERIYRLQEKSKICVPSTQNLSQSIERPDGCWNRVSRFEFKVEETWGSSISFCHSWSRLFFVVTSTFTKDRWRRCLKDPFLVSDSTHGNQFVRNTYVKVGMDRVKELRDRTTWKNGWPWSVIDILCSTPVRSVTN